MPYVEPVAGPVRIGASEPAGGVLSPGLSQPTVGETWIDLCGIRLTRMTLREYLRLLEHWFGEASTPPVAVGSVNLDHVHHFGGRRRPERRSTDADVTLPWLLLADGSPISLRATVRSHRSWPRLAGADLLPHSLDVALQAGARVGFLGGTPGSAAALQQQVLAEWPGLLLTGCWTPSRADLVDPRRSSLIATEIARAGVDLLVVGLGKPLQEHWIDEHGEQTGARVLTAFGGAADFLGRTTRRAPRWMRAIGCEWLFRLATEPRRLSRRYLLQGPPALCRVVVDRPERGLR